jgi:hypothetical protein
MNSLTMKQPEAKGKIRKRHEAAIERYKTWLKRHPKASIEEKVKFFDESVDKA